jgi:hypothetical protein
MKGFFREDDFKSGNYSKLLEFIKTKFPGIPFSELNLEEIVTFLELSLDTFGSFGANPEAYIYEAKREFGMYVNYRLKIPDLVVFKEHKKIIDEKLAGLDSGNSIITLNYDLIIDNTLFNLSPKNDIGELNHGCLLGRMYAILGKTELMSGERASLYHDYKELGFYLKLHGSIDWLYCSNTTCGNHQLFYPNEIGRKSIHDKPGDPCCLCGSPLVNVIIPPTMIKTFEKFPKLGLLWSLAYRELNKADKIVIFGVSFAPSDYYLRWLFKKALSERVNKPLIIDIDKEPCVCTKIKDITGIEPVHKRSLDEFLEYEKNNC